MTLSRKFLPILIFLGLILTLSVALAIEIPNPLRYRTFQELIYAIIDFLFNLSIPLSALMILVAAFYYITAAGKPEQIQTAHKIILWTLIGFLIILCSKGFIEFLKNYFRSSNP